MSIASVSGRLRAERKVRELMAKAGSEPRKVWPELSVEERERMARIDEDLIRQRGGHPKSEGRS